MLILMFLNTVSEESSFILYLGNMKEEAEKNTALGLTYFCHFMSQH